MPLKQLTFNEKQLIKAKAWIKVMLNYKLFYPTGKNKLHLNVVNTIMDDLYFESIIETNDLEDLVNLMYGSSNNKENDTEWQLALSLTLLYLISSQSGDYKHRKFVSTCKDQIEGVFTNYDITFWNSEFATYKRKSNKSD